jgi:hypothetical protein
MQWLKSIDWQLVGFVSGGLSLELLNSLPRIYYWNGEREYFRKLANANKPPQ